MLKKVIGVILAVSMMLSSNVFAEEFSTKPMVSTNEDYTLALKSDGTVWAWGVNKYGSLGIGTSQDSLYPVQTKGLKDIVCVNAKGDYSMAVDSEGYVWYWGKERIDSADEFIKLSADDATPNRINAINNVKEIDSSGTYALALKKDGTVWKFDNRTPDLVQKVDGLCDIEQIQMGKVYGDSNKYFAMALDKDGNVWGWGNNKDYCLGTTEEGTDLQPEENDYLKNITKISVGEVHSLALDKDGNVWTWGNSDYSRLGRKTVPDWKPTKLNDLKNITDIVAGGKHSFALSNSGQLYGWGDSTDGQLGSSNVPVYSTRDKSGMVYQGEKRAETPMYISLVGKNACIDAGTRLSAVVTNDGGVLTCGFNYKNNKLGRPASRIESSFGNVINSDRSKFTVGTYVPNTEAKKTTATVEKK